MLLQEVKKHKDRFILIIHMDVTVEFPGSVENGTGQTQQKHLQILRT